MGLHLTPVEMSHKAVNPDLSKENYNTDLFVKMAKTKHRLTDILTSCRSDVDPALLSSSTLSDFQIICSLGVGEFGHVDLVRVDLIATNTQ